MRYVSLFSGIEAASVAWKPLGWEPVAFAEINKDCSAILNHWFPDVSNLGDVRRIDWEMVPEFDLLVGGSPCQTFSQSGTHAGREGESGLVREYIRAVRERLPRWIVWENVKGCLSVEEGAAFGELLWALDELGYCVAWRVLDAQFFGCPCQRPRVFLVGSLGNTGAANVLFDEEGLQWNFESAYERRTTVAHGDVGADGVFCLQSDDSKSTYKQDFCPTLTVGGRPAMVVQNNTVRRLTPTEYERMLGFEDGWTGCSGASMTNRYQMIANSMAVPVMRWIGERIEQYG